MIDLTSFVLPCVDKVYTSSVDTDNCLVDITKLDGCAQADYQPVNMGARRVNLAVRNCLKAPYCWLSTDNAKFSALDGNEYTFENMHVLHYALDGHFSQHIDMLEDEHHVGTLLIIVPSADLAGGELSIENSVIPTPSPTLVYMPIGTRHSVSPIVAGSRLVYIASVYSNTYNYVPIDNTTYSFITGKYHMHPQTRTIAETGYPFPTAEEYAAARARATERFGCGRAAQNAVKSALNLPTLKS